MNLNGDLCGTFLDVFFYVCLKNFKGFRWFSKVLFSVF